MDTSPRREPPLWRRSPKSWRLKLNVAMKKAPGFAPGVFVLSADAGPLQHVPTVSVDWIDANVQIVEHLENVAFEVTAAQHCMRTIVVLFDVL